MSLRIRIIGAGAAALVLLAGGIAAVGYVSAQTGSPTPPASTTPTTPDKQARRDAFIGKVASNLNVSSDQLKGAFKDAENQTVDDLLAQNKITPDRAAKLKDRISKSQGLGIDAIPSAGRGRRLTYARIRYAILESSAKAIGISDDQLKTELKDGKSIAGVAQEHTVSLDTVKSQINGDAKTKLDQAVANNKLTQAQEDALLKKLSDNLDKILNKTRGAAAAATPTS